VLSRRRDTRLYKNTVETKMAIKIMMFLVD